MPVPIRRTYIVESAPVTEPAQQEPLNTVVERVAAQIPLPSPLPLVVQQVEIQLISRALESSGYCVSKASGVLGILRTTLLDKVHKYGLKQELPGYAAKLRERARRRQYKETGVWEP